MAVHLIPNSPLAVRRSTRRPALPPTPLSTPTRRLPYPTPSRSRKRSRLQDEPDQKEQDFPITRLVTISHNLSPLTPEPTPRAIRAQKRRKLTDSDPTSPSSPSTPHPNPISPEPSHSHSSSPYIVKSKSNPSRKRKLQDDVSSDTPSPPSSDPLPRSLAKRRKLDRTTPKPARSVRITSRSKPSISTPLSTSKKRSRARTKTPSVPLPRGHNNDNTTKNVRRSARLLVHTTHESQEPSPLSPLTPPAESTPAEAPPSSETPSEEEDDNEMEMVACIGPAPTSWKATIPSHISNPVLKGRPPPNPALYAQLQLASYRRTKPNTPSPLSLYSYTGLTPPTSPSLSATINSLDAIDDIPRLGETVAVEAITVGLPQQLFHEQQPPQMQFYNQGYPQEASQQHQQSFDQPQSDYPQPANAATASSASPSDSSPPLDMGLVMMDLQFQMQLQHLGIQGTAGEGMHFGVDQMGFMISSGNTAADERNGRHQPTTVHMQDVHLHHQQPHHQNQNQNHQLYPYPYFSTEQQGQYGTTQEVIAYGGEAQSFQGQEFHQQHQFQHQHQPEYPHHHQEQSQARSSEAYGAFSPQGYEHQRQAHQQDFQQQQHGGDDDDVGSNINVGYDSGAYQTQTQIPSTPPPPLPVVAVPTTSATTAVVAASIPVPVPVPAATTPVSHYTLSMHHALLYFQQSHSRFHEDQILLEHDAADMQTRQLEEFQREKEERKRRLKRTKLVREVQVVPLGASAGGVGGVGMGGGSGSTGLGVGVAGVCSGVGRARGLWAVACKARMFEVVRIYTPALIREVTEISAREYYRRMGLRYPPCRIALARYRRRGRMREDDVSISDDGLVDRDCDHEQEGESEGSDDIFDGLSPVEKKDEVDDGDVDGEEFRKEKIFDFELFDDDEDDEEEEEVMMDDEKRKTDGDVDVDVDEEMMDDEDDEDEDEDEDCDEEEQVPETEQVDLDLEAISDPHFQPELSMRITAQEPTPSISGGVETTFYVPPVEVYALPEQSASSCEDQDQEACASSSNTNTTTKRNPKPKVMFFHRPVLPLPPPALSTFRPNALKFYNIDPVHAGRGTPCVKERREVWALLGSSSLSFSVKQARRVVVDGAGPLPSSSVGGGGGGGGGEEYAAWYACADEEKQGLSSGSSDARSAPVPAENDDSVFGDCAGTCCMTEKAKGKTKAVDVELELEEEEGEKGGVQLKEELPRREEEARGDEDGPSTSTTLPPPPPQPIAPPSPPQPTRHHLTVEIPPAHSDRMPHRRRGVIGRTELLKVYAPPTRSVPPILPLARRPPRPPAPAAPSPLGLELGPDDETEAARSSPQAYHHHQQHHPVVPYSWEQVAEAMEVLAYQGIDASVWADGHGHHHHPPVAPSSPSSLSSNGSEVQIQPGFNPSSSELSAALG